MIILIHFEKLSCLGKQFKRQHALACSGWHWNMLQIPQMLVEFSQPGDARCSAIERLCATRT